MVFVEQGRLECEAWYRCRRTTVTRWLTERGKARLIKARADFVKHQRKIRKGQPKPAANTPPIPPSKADPQMLELAIAYLQRRENGGWAVVTHGCGYIVGTRYRSADELLAMAERKGFDRRRAAEQIRAFAESV